MITESTRREFVKMLRSAAAIGLLPGNIPAAEAAAQDGPKPTSLPAPTPAETLNNSTSSDFLQSTSGVIESHIQGLVGASASLNQALMAQLAESSNGPTISTRNGPAIPFVPGSDNDELDDLEGATKEDFPEYDPSPKLDSTSLFEGMDADAY